MPRDRPRVLVAGAGLAGLTAGTFTARNGFETIVLDGGEPILARNAHLENFPGFPVGVNPRLLVELAREQARRNGAAIEAGTVVDLSRSEEPGGDDGTFVATLDDGSELRANAVVVATWSDAGYLEDLDVALVSRGSKRFVRTDDHGRTGVEGLYAAGRVAERHHQAVVAAGSGAEAALALLEDADRPFYHDWVAPEGYFTGRDREVPPGCEEIDEAERLRRERRSLEVMTEAFADHHPGEPTMHPGVVERREESGE